MTRKTAVAISKATIGTQLERDDILKILKGKFKVPQRNLTELTPSMLIEILARKLLKHKYVSLKPGKNAYGNQDLRKSDINVLKEIDII